MGELPEDCGNGSILIYGYMKFCCKKHKKQYLENRRKRSIKFNAQVC